MARDLPETRDMNSTWENFLARNDNEWCNNFGNLINRLYTFIHEYFVGLVPECSKEVVTDLDRCGQSLAVALKVLRQICVMLAPVCPFGMEKLWNWLGMETPLFYGGWGEGGGGIPRDPAPGQPGILFLAGQRGAGVVCIF